MSDKVEKAVDAAASSVACESKDEVSVATLKKIKERLSNISKNSDQSFIFEIYRSIKGEGDDTDVKTRNKK